MTANKIILVTGATGRQGGAVVKCLVAKGFHVRAMTRTPNSPVARNLATLGAVPVEGDFNRPKTLQNAVSGVYGVYSVQDHWEAGYHGEIQQGRNILDAAVQAGVQHFVYSSVGGAERTWGCGIKHFDTKHVIEEHIRESGIPATIFRPVTFFENFITWRFVRTMHDKGIFRFPFTPGRPFQMVAVDDLGAFVAEAFADPKKFLGCELELASQTLTMEDFATAVGNAIGRPVRFKELILAAYVPILWFVGLTGQNARFRVGPSMIAQVKWHKTTAPETGGWAADMDIVKSFGIPLTEVNTWAQSIDWKALRASYD